jgi:outer membrane lipoprotein carrier protein
MRKLMVALALWVVAAGTLADTTDDLVAALAGFDSLLGEFRQQQRNEQGEFVSESSGHFALLRPGYFSWEIVTPDSQLVVADPEFIWHYDRDLETVTRRPASLDGQISPMQVLGGDEAAIRAHFSVSSPRPGVFQLTPLSADAGFRALSLELTDGTLSGMQVTDNLGQFLDIRFSATRSDSSLGVSDFAFVPPPGADLFYHEQ